MNVNFLYSRFIPWSIFNSATSGGPKYPSSDYLYKEFSVSDQGESCVVGKQS